MLPKLELTEAVSWLSSFKSNPQTSKQLFHILNYYNRDGNALESFLNLNVFLSSHPLMLIKLNHYLLEGAQLKTEGIEAQRLSRFC